MRGINAGPVITRMTHTSVGGNIAMTKTVRQTVCAPRSIPSVGCAVAVRVLWAYPVPAIAGPVHLFKEAFSDALDCVARAPSLRKAIAPRALLTVLRSIILLVPTLAKVFVRCSHRSSKENPANPGPRWCLDIAGIDGIEMRAGVAPAIGRRTYRGTGMQSLLHVAVHAAASMNHKRQPASRCLDAYIIPRLVKACNCLVNPHCHEPALIGDPAAQINRMLNYFDKYGDFCPWNPSGNYAPGCGYR
jgi:hypothetical protein